MYPDNYMNPMNNPMTNPNYGYNRMQQVQQMQRAINPQVPNMFGQVEQPQQMQSFISAVPVTCLEEAKAARIALDGSMSVFVNIQDGEIYTKQLSMNGLAELKTYKLVNPQENKIEYVTSNDFNGLNQRVQNIENFLNQLGGQQNESNANDASIQPTPAMQHMFGNDPKFQQAMKMAQGKTPDQLKETALNLAKTQGIDPKQIMGVLSNFGIKI